MNPFKMLRHWLDSQTPTSADERDHRDPPDWKGFFREVFQVKTWIDLSPIVDALRHAFNQDIDYDPKRDGEEENFIKRRSV